MRGDDAKRSAARPAVALAATIAALALALVALIAPGTALAAGAKASVIGGHPASIVELPSLAYIEGEDAISPYSCSGTVVAPRVILTAGHCVEDIESGTITPATSLAVATGVADLRQVAKVNVSAVSQAVVYPGFNTSTIHGDAGLLILPTPVAAPPIPLASAPDAGLLVAGTPLTIAGWGLTNAKAKEGAAQLQAGATTIQPPSSCKQQARRYYPFFSEAVEFCAVDRPALKVSSCFGDSGGPAIASRADGTPVELGIVSNGGPDCRTSLPSVFTRVDQISAWVASWIAAVETGAPAPAIKIPRAHLPTLSFERTEELAGIIFADAFHNDFTKSSDRQISCRRLAKAKVKCGVAWFRSGNDYFGAITVSYAIRQNTIALADHYKVSWARASCVRQRANPNSCPTHVRSH